MSFKYTLSLYVIVPEMGRQGKISVRGYHGLTLTQGGVRILKLRQYSQPVEEHKQVTESGCRRFPLAFTVGTVSKKLRSPGQRGAAAGLLLANTSQASSDGKRSVTRGA